MVYKGKKLAGIYKVKFKGTSITISLQNIWTLHNYTVQAFRDIFTIVMHGRIDFYLAIIE